MNQMTFKAAAIQMPTVADKMENLRAAERYLERLAAQKPDFVLLPEMFCCPYQTQNFPVYAEEEGGPAWEMMAGLAKTYGIYLIAGSIPERDDQGKILIPPMSLTGRGSRLESTGRPTCLILM